ncbi:MAG: histidine--tRNA ligase [Verrucomicrobiae bacterium]|nr:histidine--tRNA ligase [Verrucomicrobiae bacterium]
MAQDIQPLPGFRDFFPEECAVRNRIFESWRATARAFGFEPYDGPPLESLELFRKKSGEEILGQLYHFTDKGDREVALRPEMTPTLARMIGARGRALRRPIKWFSIPQLFRYERQQRGRLREHYQFNCDILGEPGVGADAELVMVVIDALTRLGLAREDFVVRVSDRRLLGALLLKCGVESEKLPQVLGIVDKITRETPDAIDKSLRESGIPADAAKRIVGLFAKTDLESLRAHADESPEVAAALLEVQKFFGIVEASGLGEFVQFDLGIVRGLLYYTGLVFEAFDRKGEFRAICGGGRYDQLLGGLTGLDLPAAGFGMGDVVLTEILKARGKLPEYARDLDVYLVIVDDSLRPRAGLPLARQLRDAGLAVEYSLEPLGVSKQFKQAGQSGARFAVVVGPDEWKRGAVRVKDLSTGQEEELRAADLPAYMEKKVKREA